MEGLSRSYSEKAHKLSIFVVEFSPEANELLDDYNYELFMRLLPLGKQLKIRNLKFRNLQVLALINANLVNFVDSIRCGKVLKPEILRGEYGKPYLADKSFHFNISDEYNMVAIAVGASEVGIDLADVQEMIPLVPQTREWNEPSREIFSERELAHIRESWDSGPLEELLTQYWSLKEAYTKYIGLGLHYPLNKCEFIQDILKEDWARAQCLSKPVAAFTTRLSPRIFLSVVSEYETPPKLIRVPLEDLVAFCKIAQPL